MPPALSACPVDVSVGPQLSESPQLIELQPRPRPVPAPSSKRKGSPDRDNRSSKKHKDDMVHSNDESSGDDTIILDIDTDTEPSEPSSDE